MPEKNNQNEPKTITQAKAIDILKIADKLNIPYSQRGKHRLCLCFMHDDHNPSMWLTVGKNTWRCPVCCKGGDNIALVMEHEHLSFPDAVQWIATQFALEPIQENIRKPTKNIIMETTAMKEIFQRNNYSVESDLCKALVSNGILTQGQVSNAARLYHLGKSRQGNVIFWMIDQDNTICDGKVMSYNPDCHRNHNRNPFWVASWLIQHKRLPDKFIASRCLFGLHLINTQTQGIAIVESEKTAITCSQIFPEYTWLATGGMGNLTTPMLSPLKGRKIILFPDTDPDGSTYNRWKETAIQATKALNTPIMVSSYLERKATPAQKQAKIDIADLFTPGPP